MELCSDGHTEVAFEGGGFGRVSRCPVCEVIKEKDQEINELNSTIDAHSETISRLTVTLAEVRSEISQLRAEMSVYEAVQIQAS